MTTRNNQPQPYAGIARKHALWTHSCFRISYKPFFQILLTCIKGYCMKRIFFTLSIILLLLFGCHALPPAEHLEASSYNFVVIGDNRPIHKFRPEQPYIFSRVVKKAVSLNPALILNVGDLVLCFDTTSQNKAVKVFNAFEKVVAPIREKKIPLYIAMGNHSAFSEFGRKKFSRRYKDIKTQKLYYSFDVNNSHFIVLCSELKNEEAQISGEQLAWLKHDLENTAAKNIFVVLHRPLYSNATHDRYSLGIHPEKRDTLAELLKKHNVTMVFAGHIHVYNYSVIDGLSQTITAGAGAKLKGTVEDGGFYHLINVIVSGDNLDYRLIPLQSEVAQATQMIREQRYKGALSMAEKAVEFLPEHPMPNIVKTISHKLLCQDAAYNAGFSKLGLILGSRKELLFRLGEYCLEADLQALSNYYLAESAALDKNSFKVWYHYAKLKEKENLFPAAIEKYRKALSLADNPYYKNIIAKKIKKLENKNG